MRFAHVVVIDLLMGVLMASLKRLHVLPAVSMCGSLVVFWFACKARLAGDRLRYWMLVMSALAWACFAAWLLTDWMWVAVLFGLALVSSAALGVRALVREKRSRIANPAEQGLLLRPGLQIRPNKGGADRAERRLD